ncbi:MAG: DUF134 domain-containing protein [Desulfobacteraceae bacterium]|nr:DUF134 domain-containing protein [Desulfobacteraceae bacterium]
MVRPRKNRRVAFDPDVSYFKPRGIPMIELEEVCLTVDECESIRLADLIGMSHEEAGSSMGVSRATFGRIVQQARKIIADALINGKAINIEGGNYKINEEKRIFMCCKCNKQWEEPRGTGRPHYCPSCNHEKLFRVWEKK